MKGRNRRQQDGYGSQERYGGRGNGRGGYDDRLPPTGRRPQPGGARPARGAGRFGRIDQDEAAEALLGMGFAFEVRPWRGLRSV